ncbi:hypothetical protein [Asticcacaulis machinosus]|uniref:Uncharacterized protein n=1 Tax=Asticcacaulis machinosus TaxID=2984211 RepID=A0ABT5HKU7_9CAUL|nr:hypothetical protein [Asticcacaulis machinosus]MDC7676239.1 hypothetical protein [Asticcacaulis machinosus]
MLAVSPLLFQPSAYYEIKTAGFRALVNNYRTVFNYESTVDGLCLIPKNVNRYSVSVYDFDRRFHRIFRFSNSESLYIKPVSSDCLTDFYGHDAINYWSDKGDPLAKYIIIRKEIIDGNVCANAADKIKTLKMIGKERYVAPISLGVKSFAKVPEIYDALGYIGIKCGYLKSIPSSDELKASALSAGYRNYFGYDFD